MTKREKMIRKMFKMANALKRNYTLEGWENIWDMCSDWNSSHPENEEIFMCEHCNEETGLVDGFYIEDDYWIFED